MADHLAGLGRLQPPTKSKDGDYPIKLSKPAKLILGTGLRSKYYYSPRPCYDQGGTSQCVSYAGHRWMACSPIRNRVPYGEGIAPGTHPAMKRLYDLCQQNDEWPGQEPTYEGTSVRALFRVLKKLGLVSEYQWGSRFRDVAAAIMDIGPVVAGSVWTVDMFMPDRWGFLHPTGSDAGGHGYCLDGCSLDAECPDGAIGFLRGFNSWGDRWGPLKGRFRISSRAFDMLMEQDGEAGIGREIQM